MKPQQWKEKRIKLPKDDSTEIKGKPLWGVNHKIPRLCCATCYREVLAVLMMGGVCRTCMYKKLDEVAEGVIDARD